jgi:hypothetical protein
MATAQYRVRRKRLLVVPQADANQKQRPFKLRLLLAKVAAVRQINE